MTATVNASVHLDDEARMTATLLTSGEGDRFVITVRTGEFSLFLTSHKQVREFMDAARAAEVIAATLAAEAMATAETPEA